jgi:hypothetical protein
MADIGEDRSCRIAYDQGMLEIMVPYEQHEEPKILISSLLSNYLIAQLRRPALAMSLA